MGFGGILGTHRRKEGEKKQSVLVHFQCFLSIICICTAFTFQKMVSAVAHVHCKSITKLCGLKV